MALRHTAHLVAGLLALTGLAVPASAADTASQPDREPNICLSPPTGPSARDIRLICEHGREWIRAFKAGDINALMALYRPDAQVALHGQPKLIGIEAIRAYFAPTLAAKPQVEFLLHVEDIRVQGDFAYLISRYWFTAAGTDGKPFQDAGRSLLIYRRDSGNRRSAGWKIQVDIDQASPDVSFPVPPSAR